MLRSAQISYLAPLAACLFACLPGASAQNAAAKQVEGPPAGQISPELAQLLTEWSRATDGIKNLKGQHTRRVYNHQFKREAVSAGEVWFEAPDKGRIDIKEVEITSKMIDARNAPDAKIQRDNEGKPYKLVSDSPEKWICNGKQVFDIDEKLKHAQVTDLPPVLRGESILDSPLPFLFGMPPDKAVDRFRMEISKDYRPQYPYVIMRAWPLKAQDAKNWKRAEIYLNTKTYLPTSVKLLDPVEEASTVYTFEKIQVNRIDWLASWLGKSPWKPNLRGYQIVRFNAGETADPQNSGLVRDVNREKPADARVMAKAQVAKIPNVVGLKYAQAKTRLLEAGVPESIIKPHRGSPAKSQDDVYRVTRQLPAAGTELADVLRAKSKQVALLVNDEMR